MNIISKKNAKAFLFLNAFLWGSSYVWSKMLLSYLPQFTILFFSSLGGLLTISLLYYQKIKTIKKESILLCIFISSFSIVSNTFFMFALQYTNSYNAAFIVQLSVVITPLIIVGFNKRLPEGRVIVSAIGALTGIFLLNFDFKGFHFNIGDILALGNAVFFSIYLASLKINSKSIDPVHFTFIQHAVNTPVYLLLAILLETRNIIFAKLKSETFVILITVSIIVTVFTILIQSSAIRHVQAEKAVLIYTIEPVTAMILGFFFLNEKPEGFGAVAGCILIIFSIMVSLYKPQYLYKPKYQDKKQYNYFYYPEQRK